MNFDLDASVTIKAITEPYRQTRDIITSYIYYFSKTTMASNEMYLLETNWFSFWDGAACS